MLKIQDIAVYVGHNLLVKINKFSDKKYLVSGVNKKRAQTETFEVFLLNVDSGIPSNDITVYLRPLGDFDKDIYLYDSEVPLNPYKRVLDLYNYDISEVNYSNIKNVPYKVIKQLQEWCFDTGGLIPEGLAKVLIY